MISNLLDPAVLFFAAGIIAGILRSGIKLPEALYEALSIYLLLAIGLKGGVELSKSEFISIIYPILGTLLIGIIVPIVAFVAAFYLMKQNRDDASALAAHYGSVSAVTFAVVLSFLELKKVPYENYVAVLLVLLEVPAIAVGILLSKISNSEKRLLRWKPLIKEVFLSKSIYLLIAGLFIGFWGSGKMHSLNPLFIDLFKGALALFLLEMGIIASGRLKDLKKTGIKLVFFGIAIPLISSLIAIFIGFYTGLSLGGATVLSTLAASASYIAAPAAVRISIPGANPTLYLTASLGITFPFNIIFGIPLYYFLAEFVFKILG